MKPKISWRDTFNTWPSVQIRVELLPWHWRISWWSDWDLTTSFTLYLGPLILEWWANRPLFPIEREDWT